MKKYFKKSKCKKIHDRRAKRIGASPSRTKKYNPDRLPFYQRYKYDFIKAEPVVAPENICLLSETKGCLQFFTELRKVKSISKIGRECFVEMDLSEVKKFDYSSICVLIAIIRDLKSKKIFLRGNYPKDELCKKQIIESGLLTFMYDKNGNPFKKSEKSDLLFIEKGAKILKREDNIIISETIKNAVKHLTGEDKHLPKLRTILLEICGNSIEWGGTLNKQWLFGVKYEEEKAIFTITDVGKGILKTLNKKWKDKLSDVFTLNPDDEILKGAFVKKYGSSSHKINRNKGLPSVKNGFDKGVIKNLKVLTNNVILHYGDQESSEVLKEHYFGGTLYRWELTKETIKRAS
ncbi:hypothetical protein [Robertkochia solimangrovi]|uniref:hypothetical protein n=1 Tax=Robertkochia solimangrovi TaxID=2213046 RepID=UPI00117C1DFE|nr:hypothetical protein [Robertkochia solimangrovi]TRZ45135.1 hypothetical protein DMZ48_05130 [Robertkochia solimangrovi]